MGRMLEAGEESFYIARRMIRFASKDVGNADPQALAGGSTSDGGLSLVGLPEGNLALGKPAVYLATAPNSSALVPLFRMP